MEWFFLKKKQERVNGVEKTLKLLIDATLNVVVYRARQNIDNFENMKKL